MTEEEEGRRVLGRYGYEKERKGDLTEKKS